MKRILIAIIAICLLSCQKEEMEIAENKEFVAHLYRVSSSDVTGEWYFDLETSNVVNGQYARPQLSIEPLKGNYALVGGDSVLMTSSTTYVGATIFNSLTSGSMANGQLTHCELYADPVSQNSYYACVTYTR